MAENFVLFAVKHEWNWGIQADSFYKLMDKMKTIQSTSQSNFQGVWHDNKDLVLTF